MGRINNDTLYPILSSVEAGATVIGSAPDGRTNQFDLISAFTELFSSLGFIYPSQATSAGQLIVGNIPGVPESQDANLNAGGMFLGSVAEGVTVFPITLDSHINYISTVR